MKSRRPAASQNSAKSIIAMKLAMFAAAISVLITAIQPFAIAAGDGLDASTSQATSTPEATEESAKTNSDLTVDNIQDVAYTLQRIRQQAVNVYIECTRKPVSHYELNIVSLCSVPSTPLESPSAYLPLRKAWLVFFIGTMEPLVQILNEHMKTVAERTKQRHIPDKILPEWQGIVNEFKSTMKQLNQQLDVCAALVNDSEPCNIKVAESARSIDHDVTQLDSILHRASKFLHDKLPTS